MYTEEWILPGPSDNSPYKPEHKADAFAAGYSKDSCWCDENARADHFVQNECTVASHRPNSLFGFPPDGLTR
jgi:hypothetical protein